MSSDALVKNHSLDESELVAVVTRSEWLFAVIASSREIGLYDTLYVAGVWLIVVRILANGRIVAQSGTSGTLRERALLLRSANGVLGEEESYQINSWLSSAGFEQKVLE